MRFKFCGNYECPEWILSEIVNLTKISAVRLRLLAAQIIAKIKGLKYDLAKTEKLCLDSDLTPDETRSALAVLEFVIRGASKQQVEEADLMKELEQLGLPHDSTQSIIKAISKDRDGLFSTMKNSVFRISRPIGVDYLIGFVAGNSQKRDGNIVDTEIKLKISYQDGIENGQKDTEFCIRKKELSQLIYDLKKCADAIDKLEI